MIPAIAGPSLDGHYRARREGGVQRLAGVRGVLLRYGVDGRVMMEMGGEGDKRRRGCWEDMDSYRVVDKRARGGMWLCMVGMCRGWAEDGIGGVVCTP